MNDKDNLINLDKERSDRWVRIIETKLALGDVAVFGTIGETEAKILPFKREDEQQ